MSYGAKVENHIHAPHRIFRVPELVGFICRYSVPRTRLSILRVSHSFFEVAAPVVWERVVGVHHLLNLLPGFTVSFPDFHAQLYLHSGTFITMTLSSLESTSFDRFDHYGRFVRHLEIYPPLHERAIFGDNYSIEGWHRLLEQAKHRVLLPNLLRLTLSAHEMSTHDQCLWIRTFMSPSLNAIQVQAQASRLPNINSLAASVILRYITSNCPKVHKLSLFPKQVGSSTYRHSDDYSVLGLWESSELFYDKLTSLALQELACTSDILAPNTIHVLNRLPLLERLEVHCSPYGASAPIASPTESKLEFPPTLKHFALHSGGQTTVVRTLELGIFSRLSSLTITINACDPDEEETWATNLMTLISLSTPALADLAIKFDPDVYFNLTSPSTIRPLAALPLHHVCLQLAVISESVLEELHTIWPSVTEIELSGLEDPLGAEELRHFAKLPNLQHLTVDLSIDWLGSAFDSEDSIPIIAPNFHTLQCTYSADISVDLLSLATYLLSFWPNLQRFILTEPEDSDQPQKVATKDRVLANALNTIISMHRIMNKSD